MGRCRSQRGDRLTQRMRVLIARVPRSDETRGMLKNVDAVLIVAAAESTTVAHVDEVEREVAQYTNVAGIILNKCRFVDEEYS